MIKITTEIVISRVAFEDIWSILERAGMLKEYTIAAPSGRVLLLFGPVLLSYRGKPLEDSDGAGKWVPCKSTMKSLGENTYLVT